MNRRLHESQAKAPPPLDAEEKARLREQWSADKGQRQITRLAQQPVFARTPRPHLATMALHDQPTATLHTAEPTGMNTAPTRTTRSTMRRRIVTRN
jgi:hypothetical protein